LRNERSTRVLVTSLVTSIALLGGAAVAWADTSTSTAPSTTTLTTLEVAPPATLTAVDVTLELPEIPSTTVAVPESTPLLKTTTAAVTTSAVTTSAQVSSQVSVRTVLARQIQMAKKPWGARQVAKVIAKNKYKWGATQFVCLNNLWTKESGWRYRANNPRTGAYGIPQAHPGSKMSSVARDWRTNPVTQIRWGLKYIDSRYNTPCTAWSKFKRSNWY
jgi:hypothetical protein